MSKRILIIDPVASYPYDETTLEHAALGGTEASVLRVATGLAYRHRVVVAQRARRQSQRGPSGVQYSPYSHKDAFDDAADVVIVVRAHKVLPRLRRRHPEAALFLWMHCLPGRRLRGLARTCVETRAALIAVSKDHLNMMRRFFAQHDPAATRELRAGYVYNPLAHGLSPNGSAWDRDKLLFLSSPHKGLEQVLVAYETLKRRCPSMCLNVANPGYLEWRTPGLANAVNLGKLRHADVISHLRDSLCLFYPQYAFRETFGLVFAEANAVGTPVLAHAHGAAREVLADPRQLCNGRDLDAVCERVVSWREGLRPVPSRPSRFDLEYILRDWEALFEERAHGASHVRPALMHA